MAKGLVEQSTMIAIADAIRAKGVEGSFTPAQMAGAISAIVTGGGGSVEYVPTELNIIPATQTSKHIFTYRTYGDTQALDLVWNFKEPTTKDLYFIGMTNTGITTPQIFFNNSTNASDTFSSLRQGNGKAYQSVLIPAGTTKIHFTDSNYVTDYQKQCGFYISEESIGHGENTSTYLEHWNAGTPMDLAPLLDSFIPTYDDTKVIMNTTEVNTPEKIEVVTQGYLKVLVDEIEYTIYEAEGGSY